MKASDPDVTRRRDVAAFPSVREERPSASALDQCSISFGEQEPAPERRSDRSDQQSVIAPSQAPGDGPARITAESIGDPPFALLCLAEITADRACESNGTWSRNG